MDLYLFNIIHGLAGKWKIFDWLGIFLADYIGYFLILAVLILILKQTGWQRKIYFFSLISLSLILSRGIIAEVIKFFVARPRPFSVLNIQPLIDANGVNASMPSGHMAFYFALAIAVFFLNKKMGLYFGGAAILMGVARIFAGIHWPMDILVGAIIGITSAFLVKYIISAYNILVTKQL